MTITMTNNDGVMEWQGHEVLPPELFEKLQDAFAWFNAPCLIKIEFQNDTFTSGDFDDLLKGL